MSKKKAQTYCLVIDASVARVAATRERREPHAEHCRNFLAAVRRICHRVAWSEAIVAEWDQHKRDFAAQWLVSMRNLRKLRRVHDERLEELRQAIEEHSKDQNVIDKMIKDAHLCEAALATDLRVASLDEKARGHFGRLAASFPALRSILWVNPAAQADRAVRWLESGAPDKRSWRLMA